MFTYSPVMDYQEAVDFLAERILDYKEKPFVATIEGFSGIGKTHFLRDVGGVVGFKRRGTAPKLQDLRREVEERPNLDYYLIERKQYDTLYKLTEMELERHFNKESDFRILMVTDISTYLNPQISLERLTSVFQLIVNNPYILEQE